MEDQKKQNKKFNMDFAAGIFVTMVFLASVFGIVIEGERTYQDEIQEMKEDNARMDSINFELEQKIDSLERLHVLNWDNVDYWLDHFGIQHQDIVRQQIVLETGNFTSYLCKEQNNLFGMRHPRIRETTSLGSNYGHANYASYIDSIKDYALWQQYQYKSEKDYYKFLTQVGYAEATNYTAMLKNTKI